MSLCFVCAMFCCLDVLLDGSGGPQASSEQLRRSTCLNVRERESPGALGNINKI
jgi:hypothetical protein